MTTPSSFADRKIDSARERRRLGRAVLTAFAIKIVAILALALLFFGVGARSRVSVASVSTASNNGPRRSQI
jgi:hypothetical protein